MAFKKKIFENVAFRGECTDYEPRVCPADCPYRVRQKRLGSFVDVRVHIEAEKVLKKMIKSKTE